MTKIHPLASVDSKAQLGDQVEVGPFSVVEAGAVIGDGSVIGTHAYISQWARIGKQVSVLTGAVIGSNPQDLKFEGEETVIEVGNHTIIREFTTLNRGTKATGRTMIGKHCLIMAYAHVAHDCEVGDHAILVNNATLGGHVQVGEWAIIGASDPVQQFVRIGKHAYIGGFYRVPQDVPPYIRAAGDPLGYKGINSVGLTRRGFSENAILQLKRAYRILYRRKLNISHALEKIREEVEQTEEVKEVIRFIETRTEKGMM